MNYNLNRLSSFFYSSAYFNIIYNNFFEFFFKVSYVNVVKNMEKGFFEFLGPYGIYKLTSFLNIKLKQFAPFVIFMSLSYMFMGLNLFIFFLFLHMKLFIFFANNFGLFFY